MLDMSGYDDTNCNEILTLPTQLGRPGSPLLRCRLTLRVSHGRPRHPPNPDDAGRGSASRAGVGGPTGSTDAYERYVYRRLARPNDRTRLRRRGYRCRSAGSCLQSGFGSSSRVRSTGPHLKKKSLRHGADSFVTLRRGYQTLLPQTLFPNNAMSVTIHPRFERTMYFIMVRPPVIRSCCRRSNGHLSICLRPFLSVPRNGKSRAMMPSRCKKFLIHSLARG